MIFHLEFIDNDGRRGSKGFNLPSHRGNTDDAIESVARTAAQMARVYGWKPFPGEIVGGKPVMFHLYHPDFPMAERMRRVNLIQKANGNPELYTSNDIELAAIAPESIIGAHFDSSGQVAPSLLVPPDHMTMMPNRIATTAEHVNSDMPAAQPVDVSKPLTLAK